MTTNLEKVVIIKNEGASVEQYDGVRHIISVKKNQLLEAGINLNLLKELITGLYEYLIIVIDSEEKDDRFDLHIATAEGIIAKNIIPEVLYQYKS